MEQAYEANPVEGTATAKAGAAMTFAYQAQTPDEHPMSGTMEAQNAAEAHQRLETLGLRVIELKAVAAPKVRGAGGRAVAGDDFLAFNRQLAQMTAAGLPVEHGLRLIARDMRSGRLARTVEAVAGELERGVSLGEAFDRHAAKFPPLYGRLVQAGVRANDLPGMLLNLGRHLEMVQRLRAMLWRAASYPVVVMVGLVGVTLFLGMFILPQFALMFAEFKVKLPWLTEMLLVLSTYSKPIGIGVLATVLGMYLFWQMVKRGPIGRRIVDGVGLRLPLVGPVLRWNMVARWCDALRLSVDAGVDLPAGIELANEAVGSPALARDAEQVRRMIESGDAVAGALTVKMRVMPPTVPAAIALASERYDLGGTLGNLSDMYQRQAELRMGSIPTVLAPLLLIGAAGMIGVVILAVVMPLISLLRAFVRF